MEPVLTEASSSASPPSNFIRQIIDQDLKAGKNDGRVVTRFPPEPNGYLHIGHAKSICLNFGVARDYRGTCNLRFDDTNPLKENVEYVESIQDSIRWLGFEWEDSPHFASDYFEQLFDFAVRLIREGKAYVCDLNAEQMREYRGTLTEPGKESPYRNRSVDENIDLFERMRNGEFADASRTLRLKIDMSSPNVNLRDPVIYRIRRAHHHRTGDRWNIYPMYDYTHCISDSLEGITHSLCTLEFEDHRPLYDWVLDELKMPCHPQQIEFSRLNLNYTVMSKRKLLELVEKQHVNGWDDPRMPTIVGMRRRGYTPESIRDFCERVGVTKKENCIEMALLESCIREDLDRKAPRVLGVIRPLKVIIKSYDEGKVEEFDAPFHPQKPEMGSRKIPFSRTIYIERDDFMENPPGKFHRLAPGKEVRLRYAYIVKCTEVIKDASGCVVELHCTHDPDSRSGGATASRKVKGTIHWVSAEHSLPAEVRLYDRLFDVPFPGDTEGRDYKDDLNPGSLTVLTEARVERSLADVKPESRMQFERLGYFVADQHECKSGRLVFNRTVTLRDSWKPVSGRSNGSPE